MMPVRVIFNPSAQGGRAGRHLARWQAQPGLLIQPTQGAGDATRLASQAVNEGCRWVIAAGGDGTIREVVTGFMRAGANPSNTALSILPFGTVNVYALELDLAAVPRLPPDLDDASNDRWVDLVEIQFPDPTRNPALWMLQLGGAGLDARAVEIASYKLKQRIGRYTYAWSACQALTEKRGRFRIQSASGISAELDQLFVGKGKRFAGDRRLFPTAELDDGLIHLYGWPRTTWSKALRLAQWLHASDPSAPPPAWQAASPEIRLDPVSQERVPLQIDGDFAGVLPCVMSVRRRAVRIRPFALTPATAPTS